MCHGNWYYFRVARIPGPSPHLLMGRCRRSNVGAEFRNPGRRSVGLRIRVIVVRPPERRQVPAEVQFEVTRNAVTDIADLGTARLCCRRPPRTRYRYRACGRESWRCSRLARTRGAVAAQRSVSLETPAYLRAFRTHLSGPPSRIGTNAQPKAKKRELDSTPRWLFVSSALWQLLLQFHSPWVAQKG